MEDKAASVVSAWAGVAGPRLQEIEPRHLDPFRAFGVFRGRLPIRAHRWLPTRGASREHVTTRSHFAQKAGKFGEA